MKICKIYYLLKTYVTQITDGGDTLREYGGVVKVSGSKQKDFPQLWNHVGEFGIL